jgi:hypothetical protein
MTAIALISKTHRPRGSGWRVISQEWSGTLNLKKAKKNPSPGWVAGFMFRKLCRVIQRLAGGQLLRIREAVQGKIQRASATLHRALDVPNICGLCNFGMDSESATYGLLLK